MSDVGYGIRLKGDANGFVAESTRAEKSMVGVAGAAEKTKTAATTAADAVSKLGEEAGKAATATDQLNKVGTAGAATTSKMASEAGNASKAVEVLGKSNALVARQADVARTAIKLQGHQVTNLGYQLQDMAVQLAGGQSPFLVMMQQVPQAAGAVGGFANLFRLALSPAVLGVVAPVAALVGAIALIGGRVVETSARTRELTVALRAMGDVSGITGDQLRRMSEDAAASGPFSRSDTFGAAKALAFHRQLTGQMMKDVMEAGVNLAAATGEDLAKVVDGLAGSFEKGFAGIRELDEKFGFLSATELEQIRTMAEHGRQAEATGKAMELFKARVKDLATDGMSEGAKAIREMANAWNELLDRIAGSDVALTTMRGAAAIFQDIAKGIGKGSAPDIGSQVAAKSRQLMEAEKRMAELQSGQGGWSARYGTRTDLELEETKATVERLRKEIDDLVDRGRAQVAELEAGAAKAQANAGKAAVDQSAKVLGDLADQMDKQRQILAAPAPTRDLVRARLQAQDFTKDNKLVGGDAKRAEDLLVGTASAQISAGARDAAVAAKLQADAQENLARAAGQSAEAVRRAGVENKIAAFAYQYAGAGAKEYAAQLWRNFEAEEAMRRAEWTRQVGQQVAANDNLAKAYREGTAAALDHAERENEIREVIERTGASYEQAAAGVDRLRASRKALDADRALAGLKRDVEDAEALTRALGTGNPAAARRAQLDAQTRRFANDNRLSDNDNKVAEFRSLKEREYADQLRRSAVETNRARDATVRYREEMASLNEQRATGVLTEEAYKEEWKRIEREKLEASKDFADGAKRALWDYAEEAGNAAKRAETLFTNVFRSMEDALVKFVKTGKLDFASLADSIITDLIRMQIQAQITAPLSGMASSFFGNLFGSKGTQVYGSAAEVGPFMSEMGAPQAHTGGVIGHDSLVRRYISPSVFGNVSRYHVGGIVGLRPGEVPIIANRNEEVLTEDNPRHIFNAARQPRAVSGGADGGVNLSVQVVDQRSADSPPVQVSRERGPDGTDLLRILIPAIRKDAAQRGDLSQVLEGTWDIQRKRGAR